MSSYVVMKKKGMSNKEYINLLQEHLNELNQENTKLRQYVNSIINKVKDVSKEMYHIHIKDYNKWVGK